MICKLALASAWSRRQQLLLVVVTIALSVALLIGVDQLRSQIKENFQRSVSGTDLIVGARGGELQLLLYSVFHIGNASNNIRWQSYQTIKRHRQVAWAVPMSLGDSHRGYRVVGTSEQFFDVYRYGSKQPLELAKGQRFSGIHQVVLGAEVARSLGYQLGDSIVLAHGTGNASFAKHADQPFDVVGILSPTGTPVDRALYVSSESITALHVNWQNGVPLKGAKPIDFASRDLTPTQLTAILVGMKSKLAIFPFQRSVNQYRKEPLQAALPGVALQQLWQLLGTVEKALYGVSLAVVLVGMLGMVAVLLASLTSRRREMAILRAMGATPWQIIGLLVFEALCLALLGIVFGLALCALVLTLASPWLLNQYGLFLSFQGLSAQQWLALLGLLLAATMAALWPGYRAYRRSVSDGLGSRSV